MNALYGTHTLLMDFMNEYELILFTGLPHFGN